jgi:hypothetical protein
MLNDLRNKTSSWFKPAKQDQAAKEEPQKEEAPANSRRETPPEVVTVLRIIGRQTIDTKGDEFRCGCGACKYCCDGGNQSDPRNLGRDTCFNCGMPRLRFVVDAERRA